MRERCFLVKKKKKRVSRMVILLSTLHYAFLRIKVPFFFFCIIELLKPKLITSHMFFLEKVVKLKHIESK